MTIRKNLVLKIDFTHTERVRDLQWIWNLHTLLCSKICDCKHLMGSGLHRTGLLQNCGTFKSLPIVSIAYASSIQQLLNQTCLLHRFSAFGGHLECNRSISRERIEYHGAEK